MGHQPSDRPSQNTGMVDLSRRFHTYYKQNYRAYPTKSSKTLKGFTGDNRYTELFADSCGIAACMA